MVKLFGEGKHEEAIPLAERVLDTYSRLLGPDHSRVAAALNNLSGLHYLKNDFARAESYLRRAISVHEKALGPDHPALAQSLFNLAMLMEVKGDYAAAIPPHERALAGREKA